MIYIYYSFYEENSSGIKEVEKNSQREHRIGRELLCRGLYELYGIRAGNVDSMLCKGKFGKPYLRERPDISFNISHCPGLVTCAFSGKTGQPDRAIGIDVEAVRPVRDPLIRRVLHEEEIRVLSRFGEIAEKSASGKSDTERSPEFLRLFFRYWTLKESCLKRDGCGLTKEPGEISFTVDPEEWERPVYASDPTVVCMQKLFSRPGTGEFVLSVCVPRRAETEVLQLIPF